MTHKHATCTPCQLGDHLHCRGKVVAADPSDGWRVTIEKCTCSHNGVIVDPAPAPK